MKKYHLVTNSNTISLESDLQRRKMGNKLLFILALIMLHIGQSSITAEETDQSGYQSNGAASIAMATNRIKPKHDMSYQSGTVTIVDDMGRKVLVKRPVKSIAFSHSATAEALKILDAWHMVAGRCQLQDTTVFPNLDKIPVVRSGQNVYELNYEELFSTGTDTRRRKFSMTRRDDTIALRHMLDHAEEAVRAVQDRTRTDLDNDRFVGTRTGQTCRDRGGGRQSRLRLHARRECRDSLESNRRHTEPLGAWLRSSGLRRLMADRVG